MTQMNTCRLLLSKHISAMSCFMKLRGNNVFEMLCLFHLVFSAAVCSSALADGEATWKWIKGTT